jgi:hypothetical protein
LVTLPVNPRDRAIVQLVANPRASFDKLTPISSRIVLLLESIDDLLRIKLDDYVAKMISCHKLKGFVQTGSFRHIHIERNETNPRPRPIAAAINPPQDQSKSPTATSRK